MKPPIKKPNYFLRFIFISFIIYAGLYIAVYNGYYEKQLQEEVLITKDNIKEFEADIKAGKQIDLKNYNQEERHDYSNIFSKSGKFLGTKFDYIITDGVKDLGSLFKDLFGNN